MESAPEWNQHQKINNLWYTLKFDDQNLRLNKYTLTLIKDIFTKSSTLSSVISRYSKEDSEALLVIQD